MTVVQLFLIYNASSNLLMKPAKGDFNIQALIQILFTLTSIDIASRISSRCMLLLLTMYIKQRSILPYLCAKHSMVRRTIPGKEYSSKYEFTSFVLSIFPYGLFFTTIQLLLLQSGNVHPHLGPSSASSDTATISTLFSTLSSLHTLGLSRHLSFVHYNVQSIVPKLDTIMAELSDFDILAFSET